MKELDGRVRRLLWRLGRKLYCTARGEGANQIDINGESYVQERVLAAAKVGEILTIFDVGANLGRWTESLWSMKSECSATVEVWAFEPTPESYKAIQQRFADNSNVRCMQLALSDESGLDRMMLTSATGGTNTLSYDDALLDQAACVAEIRKTTAADFCLAHRIDRVHFLKCDTEGHDLRVIEGARSLLEAERIDILQFEYNHRWIYSRSFLKDVFDIVAKLPYTIAAVRPSRIELFKTWHPELDRFFEANYLLVHERALCWFDTLDGNFDISNTYA